MSKIVIIIALLAFFSMLPLNSPALEQGLLGEYLESGRQSESHADMFCTGVLKPPLDIQLEVTRLDEMDGERGIAELLLTVTPLIECSNISWEITTPAGLSSLSGQLKGTETVTLGEKKTRTITLSVPDGKRYYLYAKATLEAENGVVFTNAVSPYIDLGTPEIKYTPFIRRDSVRGDVTSFKGIVADGGDR